MKFLYKILFIFLFSVSANAVDLGKVGSTYKIIEEDLLQVIKTRAASLDWNAIVEKEKAGLKERIGKIDKAFLKAPKNNTRYIDMTTSLKEPIYVRSKNGTKKLLYPKGYKFNVLDYTKTTQRYVYFDASRKEEIDWFNKNYRDNLTYMPIISKGSALEFSDKIGREVYLIDDEQVKTFKIKYTPVVVYQENNMMRADEYYLKAADDDKKK